jgi:hypothetical protein
VIVVIKKRRFNRKYTQMNANLRLEVADVTESFSRKRRATVASGIGRTRFFHRAICVHSRSFAVSIKKPCLIDRARPLAEMST